MGHMTDMTGEVSVDGASSDCWQLVLSPPLTWPRSRRDNVVPQVVVLVSCTCKRYLLLAQRVLAKYLKFKGNMNTIYLGMYSRVYATGHIKDPVPHIEKRRGLSPGGRFPPSLIHQVIIITGLNKLYNRMFSP